MSMRQLMNKEAAVWVMHETNTDTPHISLCSLAAMVLCLLFTEKDSG